MESVFSRLPEYFFIPLASPNRRHYAALLLLYYRLFMEYRSSVERELVVARFSEYFAGLDVSERVEDEDDLTSGPTGGTSDGAPATASRNPSGGMEPLSQSGPDARGLANLFLRKLIAYGWMAEEEQLDFSRVVNLCVHARPFFEALDTVERGASVEYESHIVAVYSSLCSDAARDNGEHAVLNAHWHTRLLVESLKVLEQNIKSYVQEMFKLNATIPDILHAHYDVYMHEVVDRAYTRLKTSDNLSRYRPRISRAIGGFLKNEPWMARTAEKLANIQRATVSSSKERIREMLVEIRDELKSIDPILESIDDRNRRYSRISTERIRTQLHADSSLQAKIARIVRAMSRDGSEGSADGLGHRIFRLRHLAPESLYTRQTREVAESGLARHTENEVEAEIAAAELRLRITNQLNPAKVAEFLSTFCPAPGATRSAEDMVDGVDSFVRLIYAADYAEARDRTFPFSVDWREEMVTVGRFSFRSHQFVRRYPNG
jgi:Wadjet protein JetA